MPLKICFVASEIAPLAKTGGLADVAGVLPRHLHELGHDVRVFMPLYSTMSNGAVHHAPTLDNARQVPLALGPHRYTFSLLESQLPNSSVPLYLVHCPEVYDRPSLYTSGVDEHLRFLVLQRAALDGCQRMGFAPDVMHCNDWHTALMPMMLKSVYAWDGLFANTRSVLSIHNIGYQGIFSAGTTYDIGGEVRHLVSPETLAGGAFNWLREGVRHADRVTTVSPTYAQEICSPIGGHGLDGALRARADGVVGILNGVDYSEWNPATDRYLKHHFSPQDLSGKLATKRSLLDWLNLSVSDSAPMMGIVSRMTVQKGFDLLFDSLPHILATRDMSLVALGSGEPHYEGFFVGLQQRFPDRVVFHRGYHEELAHLIEAASDMFLMPSQYEPCGLNQMYSLKYGTAPIVRRTGGLADSVQMWDPATRQGTGVVFNDFDVPAVTWAIHTALDFFKDQDGWRQLMRNGMAQDFSWDKQTGEYVRLYRDLTGITS
ncbi:MAG TPA: glycogen synthase [Steroidobacter sp.]|uniref:glycogen synthase n=1 Tax=Steroidobacter sp. TaxID=1978227 RepID=UPI002EDA24C8